MKGRTSPGRLIQSINWRTTRCLSIANQVLRSTVNLALAPALEIIMDGCALSTNLFCWKLGGEEVRLQREKESGNREVLQLAYIYNAERESCR